MNQKEIDKAIEQHELFNKVVTMFINECLDNKVQIHQIRASFDGFIEQEVNKRQ